MLDDLDSERSKPIGCDSRLDIVAVTPQAAGRA